MDWYINTPPEFKAFLAIFLSGIISYIMGYKKGKENK